MTREYQRPRVGVSACLLGDPVRYNGGHKRHAWLVDVLGSEMDLVAVCPEVEVGLGTPRETIDLVLGSDGVVRLLTTNTRIDLSDCMRQFAAQRIDALACLDLSGFVLKADSPSCGPGGVRVVGSDETARGLFAETLMTRLPHLPVVDECALDDPARCADFVARVRAYDSSTLRDPQGRPEPGGGATGSRRHAKMQP